jgi:hypothetical protein
MPELGSALVAVRLSNARSFRYDTELSMRASALSESGVARELPLVKGRPSRVLPAVGVFGGNASGKSNLLMALADARHLVVESFRQGNPSGGVRRFPFRAEPAATPTRFEFELVLQGVPYVYGFSVDDRRVQSEWCFHAPRGVMRRLFEREVDDVLLGAENAKAGRAARQILRPNALLLSTAAATGHPTLLPIYEWFQRNLLLAETVTRPLRQVMAAGMMEDPAQRTALMQLIHAADLGIAEVSKRQVGSDELERLRRVVVALTGDDDVHVDAEEVLDPLILTHEIAGTRVDFRLGEESLGTQVWLGLVGPLVHALANGSVLLADELDASLHPDLCQIVVRLFQDTRTNPNRAQLIFNAHDLTLLGDSEERALGRDQIWFTEKHASGETVLRSLADQSPRRNEALGRRYAAGMYGGKPMLAFGDFVQAVEPVLSGDRGR